MRARAGDRSYVALWRAVAVEARWTLRRSATLIKKGLRRTPLPNLVRGQSSQVTARRSGTQRDAARRNTTQQRPPVDRVLLCTYSVYDSIVLFCQPARPLLHSDGVRTERGRRAVSLSQLFWRFLRWPAPPPLLPARS